MVGNAEHVGSARIAPVHGFLGIALLRPIFVDRECAVVAPSAADDDFARNARRFLFGANMSICSPGACASCAASGGAIAIMPIAAPVTHQRLDNAMLPVYPAGLKVFVPAFAAQTHGRD